MFEHLINSWRNQNALRASSRQTIRTVRLAMNSPHDEVVAAYILPGRSAMYPNVRVFGGSRLLVETNMYGLRGPLPTDGRLPAIIWGDSVVSGGWGENTWVEMINQHQDKYWVFNGGIPGDEIGKVVQRALTFQKTQKLKPLLNVIVVGWHPSTINGPRNDGLEESLVTAIRQLKNAVIATSPSALIDEMIGHDFSSLAKETDPRKRFALLWPPTSTANWIKNGADRQLVAKRVAEKLGLPYFDWSKAFRTSSLDDALERFFDPLHPRKEYCHAIAGAWANWLVTRLDSASY